MLEKFFKLSENGTDVRADRCRYYNIHDNGVYQLSIQMSCRLQVWITVLYLLQLLASLISTLLMAPTACKLSVCTGSWYGTECIFCIHSCTGNGLYMTSSSDSRIRRGYCVYCLIPYQCA